MRMVLQRPTEPGAVASGGDRHALRQYPHRRQAQQRAARKIAEKITDTLERIAHKPKSYPCIAFDELPDENWAIAGKLLDEE